MNGFTSFDRIYYTYPQAIKVITNLTKWRKPFLYYNKIKFIAFVLQFLYQDDFEGNTNSRIFNARWKYESAFE